MSRATRLGAGHRCVSGVHTSTPIGVDSEFLTTGQAAELLGLSRQGVVDLCDRGQLPFTKVGSHRRLRRSTVKSHVRRSLTRDQERSLWLHRVVAGRLAVDPVTTLATARRNLATMRQAHHQNSAMTWIDQWSTMIDGPIDVVADVLTSRSSVAIELRQNSPFAGVVSEEDRHATLQAFREHWRREHAA